jgi:hypothetical protein
MMCKICVYTFQLTVAPLHYDHGVIDIHRWIAAIHCCRVFSKKHHWQNVEVLNTTSWKSSSSQGRHEYLSLLGCIQLNRPAQPMNSPAHLAESSCLNVLLNARAAWIPINPQKQDRAESSWMNRAEPVSPKINRGESVWRQSEVL